MSSIDPIANLISLINNGQRANKEIVIAPYSKHKLAICQILLNEGYLDLVSIDGEGNKKNIIIKLKYFQGSPVISSLSRISKPGKRMYASVGQIPYIIGGLGLAIISTPKGVMSDKAARKIGVGGELICSVS